MTDALDLFRGAGGWSCAARDLGIEDYGVEIMPEANATAEAAGFKTLHDDVWTLDVSEGDYDTLIASPPCQTFSAAGKGAGRKALEDVLTAIRNYEWTDIGQLHALGERVGDERTALVLTPLHHAHILRPRAIAWEQVPTVLPVWEACAEQLRLMGYSVWTGNLQAEQYGVPQTRKRAFLIARRDAEVAPPTPTHSRYYSRSPEKLDPGVLKWVSMAEALNFGLSERPAPTVTGGGVETGDAEPIAKLARYTSRPDWIPRGQARNSGPGAARTPRSIDEPSYTIRAQGSGSHPSGVEWVHRGAGVTGLVERSLDEPATTVTGKGTAYWERRDDLPEWAHNRPSTTIVGTFKPEIVAAPGYRTTVSRQNAPNSVRVTVQEAGVLQSFPADHPWLGSKSKQYLQVGNACPPLLAKAVLGVTLDRE